MSYGGIGLQVGCRLNLLFCSSLYPMQRQDWIGNNLGRFFVLIVTGTPDLMRELCLNRGSIDDLNVTPYNIATSNSD